MNIRIIKSLLPCIFLLISQFVSGQKFLSKTELLKGEKWFGWIENTNGKSYLNGEIDSKYTASGVLVSSHGRYVSSNKPFTVTADGKALIFGSDFEKPEVRKGGKNLREAYLVYYHKNRGVQIQEQHTDFFNSPFYETEFTLGYDQGHDELLDYARRILDEGFPPGYIVISNGWESISEDYIFDPILYPEPEATFRQLSSLGFTPVLTVSPLIPFYGKNFIRYEKNGWLKSNDGETIIIEKSGRKYAIADISNSEVAGRIRGRLKGIIASSNCLIRFSGARALEKELGNFMVFMDGESGLNNKIQTIGASPAKRSNIIPNVTADLSETVTISDLIQQSVAAGLSGDIPGYISVDAYNRSALAEYLFIRAVMPVMTIDVAPWDIDPSTRKALKNILDFRMSLNGYISDLIKESVQTGEPLVRHMEYHFPRNGFSDCDDQFMLGNKYIVAPVKNGEGKRMVRLPKGNWMNREGTVIKGPLVLEVDSPTGAPIFFTLVK